MSCIYPNTFSSESSARKWHRNGIKKPKSDRYESLKGVSWNWLLQHRLEDTGLIETCSLDLNNKFDFMVDPFSEPCRLCFKNVITMTSMYMCVQAL